MGEKPADISVDELQSKLADIDNDGKVVKRLVAAIVYKQATRRLISKNRSGSPRTTFTSGSIASKNAVSTGRFTTNPLGRPSKHYTRQAELTIQQAKVTLLVDTKVNAILDLHVTTTQKTIAGLRRR